MFKLKIDKLNFPLFKTAIKILGEINKDELTFVVAANQIMIGSFAKSKSEAGLVSIHPDFFSEFENDTPESIKTFALQPQILNRILKRFKHLSIEYDGKMGFVSDKKKFVVPSYLPEITFPEPLFKNPKAFSIVVPNDFISDAITDMKVDGFSDTPVVFLDLHDKKLKISRKTDWVQTAENTIDVDSDGEASMSTSLESFGKIITDMSRRAESTRLELEDKEPVIAKYIFPEGIKMFFALAPYGEEDGEDDWNEDDEDDSPEEIDDKEDYKESGVCMCCNNEKNNINPATGCCWECDEE